MNHRVFKKNRGGNEVGSCFLLLGRSWLARFISRCKNKVKSTFVRRSLHATIEYLFTY